MAPDPRQLEIDRDLFPFLELVAVGMSAGYGLMGSIEHVVPIFSGPIADGLREVAERPPSGPEELAARSAVREVAAALQDCATAASGAAVCHDHAARLRPRSVAARTESPTPEQRALSLQTADFVMRLSAALRDGDGLARGLCAATEATDPPLREHMDRLWADLEENWGTEAIVRGFDAIGAPDTGLYGRVLKVAMDLGAAVCEPLEVVAQLSRERWQGA